MIKSRLNNLGIIITIAVGIGALSLLLLSVLVVPKRRGLIM